MLCSISATGKSSSKWLDRLRSSKGFPSGADLDLEQFLSNNQNARSSDPDQEQDSSTSTSESKRSPNDPAVHDNQTFEAQNPDGDTGFFSVVSNVLAELFVMGSSNGLPKVRGKKSSRKQPNPKFCASLDCPESNTNLENNSTRTESAARKNESASPMSDDNSGVGMAKECSCDKQLKLVEYVNCGDEEEKEKGYMNFSGFSRTEVTVIDSSFATWKFEKMLFRKKNVWKVRDKKGKTLTLGKKKRKASASFDDQISDGTEEKKQKFLHGRCSLSKKGCGGAPHEVS